MAQEWHRSGYIREPETDWKVEWSHSVLKSRGVPQRDRCDLSPHCCRICSSPDVPIAPDSGVYHIDWSISRNEHSGTADRQPSGSVEGRIAFDSNGDMLRRKLKIENNI